MKLNSIIIGLLFLVTIVSCKNEEKNETSDSTTVVAEKPELNKNIFTITLNAVVKKNDSFQLYYKNEDAGAFEEKNSFFIEFNGSEQPQDIVFRLPEDEVPNYFRLDFGTNKEQSTIEIKNVRIDYLDKKVEIKGTDFFNYFYANPLTAVIDAKLGTLTPIVGKDGGYDPMTASAEGLKKQIDILIK